jgi:hypothetical protein
VHRTVSAVLLWQQCCGARTVLRRGHAREIELCRSVPGITLSQPKCLFVIVRMPLSSIVRRDSVTQYMILQIYTNTRIPTRSYLKPISTKKSVHPTHTIFSTASHPPIHPPTRTHTLSSTWAFNSGACSPNHPSTRTDAFRPLTSCNRTAAWRIAARRGWRRSRADRVQCTLSLRDERFSIPKNCRLRSMRFLAAIFSTHSTKLIFSVPRIP